MIGHLYIPSIYRENKAPLIAPVIEPIVVPTAVSTPTIDAAKRRQLPAWIREGTDHRVSEVALVFNIIKGVSSGYISNQTLRLNRHLFWDGFDMIHHISQIQRK